jgi:hypothetical protein
LAGPRGMAASRRAIKARDFGPGIAVRIWMVLMISVSPFSGEKQIPRFARNDTAGLKPGLYKGGLAARLRH